MLSDDQECGVSGNLTKAVLAVFQLSYVVLLHCESQNRVAVCINMAHGT